MRSRGVEPPRPLGAQASETCVSANSTTTAYWKLCRNVAQTTTSVIRVLSSGAGAYGFDQCAASVSFSPTEIKMDFDFPTLTKSRNS